MDFSLSCNPTLRAYPFYSSGLTAVYQALGVADHFLGDEAHLMQVIITFLSNAVKFSPHRSHIGDDNDDSVILRVRVSVG